MSAPTHEPSAIHLAARVAALSGEGALDVFTRARALEARGRRVAHLELGEPDFPSPAHVIDAGVRALRDGETRYTSPAGIPELRSAVAEAARARGISVGPEQILITPGAKPMLFYAAISVIEPGDEVLVPDPGFPIYPSVTRFCGGIPVTYGLRESERFAPDVDQIEERITPRTRVLMLNAPHNPTGGSVDRATLERIAALAERHDLTILSDEVYGRLVYDGEDPVPSVASIPGAEGRTIVIDSFSKTYAMTGWRLGYGILPRPMVERATTLAINGHTCTPVFVQRAGVAALTGPQEPVRAMVAEFRRRRDIVTRGLNAIPGVSCAIPAGAFYAFPNVRRAVEREGISAGALADRVLQEQGVAVLTGTAFGAGGEGHIRISFAASTETIEFALAGLRATIETLRA